MKKILITSLLISFMSLSISTSYASGYKTCLVHDIAYKIIPSFMTCPLVGLNKSTSTNKPSTKESSRMDNQFTQINYSSQSKEVHIHHPDCYSEHDGGPE